MNSYVGMTMNKKEQGRDAINKALSEDLYWWVM